MRRASGSVDTPSLPAPSRGGTASAAPASARAAAEASAGAATAGAARQAGIVSRAVRGAFWTILSGTGGRVLGIVGTLAVTHFLRPEEYGEVSIAALLMLTANTVANLGVSQYIAGKPDAERAAVFHATFYYLLLGAVALGLAALLGAPFGVLVGAPDIGKYMPLLAAAVFLDRVATLQDRILLRDLRFRTAGLLRSLGELTYAVTSVALAALCAGTIFGGAFALAWAMLARGLVRAVALGATTPWREWIEPHPITAARTRELFAFGVPMSLASVANFGSSKFDNFVYSHHFGEAGVGKYNLAYNFADMPAALIAETVGDVLVPSFAHMDDRARRRDAFLLALETLVFVVTPLGLGLAMVAPELVALAFPPEYESVTRTLRILALIAVPRTIIWTAIAYLQVEGDPRVIMLLETARMVGIVVVMHLAAVVAERALGPDAAVVASCSAVVAVFAWSALGYMGAIRRLDAVPLAAQLRSLLSPALACVPMMVAVYALQHALGRPGVEALSSFAARARAFGPRLAAEILVGAVAFVPSALLLAPGASRQLRDLVGAALDKKRRAAAVDVSAA